MSSGQGSGQGSGHSSAPHPLKPTKSADPGWKYGHYKSITEKNAIVCELCGYISHGGIGRHKQHLAHLPGSNARKCDRVTPEISREIADYIGSNSRKRHEEQAIHDAYADADRWEDEEDEDIVELDEDPSVPSYQKQRSFGSGARLAGAARATVGRGKRGRGVIDRFFCRPHPEDVVNARRKEKMTQTTIENRFKKEDRNTTIQYFAKWMYQSGISFNAVKKKSFKVFFEAIGRFGPGLKPPTYHELRGPLLKVEKESTDHYLEECKKGWLLYGCTLMCDGWTDRTGRSLINFLANCPTGTVFLDSVDASGHTHTHEYLFSLMDKYIQQIGPEHVVQVVTDNAANYKKAGIKMMEIYAHIFWTPCAAHCLDLILEAIGRKYIRTICAARRIPMLMYKHTRLLNLMRVHLEGNLLRPAVTRFASAFLTLQRLRVKKAELRSFVTSSDFTTGHWANKPDAKKVVKTILSESFWKNVNHALWVSQPIVEVLRLVDGEKPPMGYIYEAMEQAKEKIVANCRHQAAIYQPALDIINQKWGFQMSSPLYNAGFLLNPSIYYHKSRDEVDAVHMSGFYTCLERMIPNLDEQDKISQHLDRYKNADGEMFARDLAIRHRDQKTPTDWWSAYGVDPITRDSSLKRMALRVLGLTCASSGCERNWSTFEMIHTKKRNRLAADKLRDLVYVAFNQKLRERQLARMERPGFYDPIVLDDEEHDDHPWTVETDEPVFRGETLTWAEVERAAFGDEGASSSRPTQATRRRASTHEYDDSEDEIEEAMHEDVDDLDTQFVESDDEETEPSGDYVEERDSDSDPSEGGPAAGGDIPSWIRDQCFE